MKAAERSAQVAALEARVAELEKSAVESSRDREAIREQLAGHLEWLVELKQGLRAVRGEPSATPPAEGGCAWVWLVGMVGAGVAALAGYEHLRMQRRAASNPRLERVPEASHEAVK